MVSIFNLKDHTNYLAFTSSHVALVAFFTVVICGGWSCSTRHRALEDGHSCPPVSGVILLRITNRIWIKSCQNPIE